MKINWIEFRNLQSGLVIKKIKFYNDITLLVGLSGVGKSQILNAVEYSLHLAIDKNIRLKPYEVTMSMEINGNQYTWSYKIDKSENEDVLFNETNEYKFVYEKLEDNKSVIFERDEKKINVNGYDNLPTPKFDESLILQYSSDSRFTNLTSEFKKLYSIETELEVRGALNKESFVNFKQKMSNVLKANSHLDFKVFSHLPVVLKLYIVKNYYEDLYIKIFDYIKEIFMEIEEIDVVEDPDMEAYLVAIKVYGKTLLQQDISNGMLKSIYYIVELVTMPLNSLVLIDEFENGLGVNCIDVLSDLMLSERPDLQFIITSHHPKIINQISKENWKIIDRTSCEVINSDSQEYGVGNSQHDAYFNLINRWEYEGKI